eukprot:1161837-Pelagomonas_calceolata.AAC.2
MEPGRHRVQLMMATMHHLSRERILLPSPSGMHRRITNTTRYDLKARKISWRVEWAFPSAGIHYTDNSVSEECILTEVRQITC